jgi:hypothetical protein
MGLRRTRQVTMFSADSGYCLLRYQSACRTEVNGALRDNQPDDPFLQHYLAFSEGN